MTEKNESDGVVVENQTLNPTLTSTTTTNRVDTTGYTCLELMAGDVRAWFKIWQPEWTPDQPITFKNTIRLVWNYMGLRAALLYRLSHLLWLKRVPALPGMLARLNITLHGFDIPAHVPIGPGLYVPHPVGTVVTANRIGKNLSLISANTIGMRNEHSFPNIGDNVFLGAGARVLGGITIGDNVVIGANAVVIEDVPPNSTAMGVPAKISPRKVSNVGGF